MIPMSRVALSLVFLAFACTKDEPVTPQPAAGQPGTAPEHAPHTDRIALGELSVGGVTIAVFQVAPVAPGKEGDFDLDIAAGVPSTGVIRGWIGVESAEGSMKTRFEKETATRMHGHPEVPMTMPDGSKLWLEVESAAGTQRASIAFRP